MQGSGGNGERRQAEGLAARGALVVLPQLLYLVVSGFALVGVEDGAHFADAFGGEEGLYDAFAHLETPEFGHLQAGSVVRAQENLHRLLPRRQRLLVHKSGFARFQ